MSVAYTTRPGTKTAFTVTLNSLANVTYVAATAVDFLSIAGVTSNCLPTDIILELVLTPGTVAGNKQAILFVQASLDNSVFSSGPTSGTTTTDQPDLYFIGALPLNTSSTQQAKQFSVLAALGFIPRALKPVIFNDSGAALAGSGNSCSYQVYAGDGT
jgi:hypothetical protein